MLHQLPDGPVFAWRRIAELAWLDAPHDPIRDVAGAFEHVDI